MPCHRLEQITERGSQVSGRWHDMWAKREVALRHRMGKMVDCGPMEVGQSVQVQNQAGNQKTRWDKSSVVHGVDLPNDRYLVQMDSFRWLTTRNRKFLHRVNYDWVAAPGPDEGAGWPRHRPSPKGQEPQVVPPGSHDAGHDSQPCSQVSRTYRYVA